MAIATPAHVATAAPPAARPTAGLVLLLGALTAFGAMSIDLYLPSLPSMGRALHASPGAVGATLSAFLAGMGIGQLVHGPLSDRIGRRPPLLGGIALYVLASIVAARAPGIAVLIGARFVQGLGGCAALVVSRAVVRDRFPTHETARVFSLLTLVLGVAPVLAPLAGSALLAAFGWRAIFWALTLFGVIAFGAVWFGLAETRSAAARAAARTHHPARVYWRLLRLPRLQGHLLAMAFSGASLFVYVASSSTLFIGDFGLSPVQFSALFASNAMTAWGPGAGLWTSYIFASLTMATYGFAQANLTAETLAVDPGHAGSVAALAGTASFVVGAIAATVATAMHDGTARPPATVIAACASIAAAAYFGLARRR